MKTLDEIGLKHGTDKSSLHHDYLRRVYEPLFAPLREQKIALLEIGVQFGFSLRTWREYFPNAKIAGIDIAKAYAPDPGIEYHIGNGADPSFITEFLKRQGEFDIIIDDGSHYANHIIASATYFWGAVKPGGFYIIEDLHCAYRPDFVQGFHCTPIDFIRHRIDDVMQHGAGFCGNPNSFDKKQLNQFESCLEYVQVFKSVAIFKKRGITK